MPLFKSELVMPFRYILAFKEKGQANETVALIGALFKISTFNETLK